MSDPISRREALSLLAVAAAGGALLTREAFAEEAGNAGTALMPEPPGARRPMPLRARGDSRRRAAALGPGR